MTHIEFHKKADIFTVLLVKKKKKNLLTSQNHSITICVYYTSLMEQ